MLKVNQDESEAKIKADKIKLEGYTTVNENFSIDLEGNMSCNNATVNGSIGGWSISSDGLSNSDGTFIESDGYSNIYNVVDLYILTAMLRGDVPWIPMPQSGTPEFERYDLNKDGVIDLRDLTILRRRMFGE